MYDLLWPLAIILLVVIIIIMEYFDNDCLAHKECYHRVQNPNTDNSVDETFNQLRKMLVSNLNIVTWRQSLIAAIAATIFITIFLYSRFPSPWELLFIGFLIFICVYFAFSWMWTHFYSPNTRQIENGLNLLQDKLEEDRNN